MQWCERRLLARIHRYTVERLRAEIEPVTAADFMRFLFEWHGLAAEPRPEGPQALGAILEQLEGFEAAASAWETDILPARTDGYDPDWLDSLCRSGRVLWARLTPPKTNGARERAAGPVRNTPIALLARRSLRHWQSLAQPDAQGHVRLGARARAVAEYLEAHGASFFEELTSGTGLLKSEVEEALRELVALGRIQADGYSGLRSLLLPADRRRGGWRRRTRTLALSPIPSPASGRGGRAVRATHGSFNIEDAGRWSLLQRPTLSGSQEEAGKRAVARSARAEDQASSPAATGAADPLPHSLPLSGGGKRAERRFAPTENMIEQVARTLLRRYGVVFRKLLAREPDWLPPWIELLRVYRRLEARGEIRGGRFVAGVSGEQYALAEAVPMLRAVRKKAPDDRWISISAADPLNLVGIVTPGARVPALSGNRVLYRAGVPLAVQIGDKAEFLQEIPAAEAWNARNALIRGAPPASTAAH